VASDKPQVSIIIPVLHETSRINAVIEHLRGRDTESIAEIIVVDGDPKAGTVSEIKDARVQRLVSVQGRASQMNRGAAMARADILLFLHADTLLPDDAFSLIRAAMDEGRCAAGAFALGIDSERSIFRVTEKYVAFRTRLTQVPFGDQAIFIRRTFFEQLGGYKELPIMEDVDLMQRIRKRGSRIRILTEKVLTSPRRYEREGVLYCTLRNWSLQLLYALGVSPERLAGWYRS
jgi:rSAM/selenodomain-associated transferase 2